MSKTTDGARRRHLRDCPRKPYVQRLIEDEELATASRTPLKAPRAHTGGRPARQGNRQGGYQRQEGPEGPAQGRREPAGSFREPALEAEAQGGLGRLLLIAIVGAIIALALSEGARKAVLDALFGAERSSSTRRPPASTGPERGLS